MDWLILSTLSSDIWFIHSSSVVAVIINIVENKYNIFPVLYLV